MICAPAWGFGERPAIRAHGAAVNLTHHEIRGDDVTSTPLPRSSMRRDSKNPTRACLLAA